MFTYYSLKKGNTRLCDIVMAGSHDAGITSGNANIQTQNLDIFDQAVAGVRVFDLRIAATKPSRLSAAPVSLHAFHADKALMHNKDKKNKEVFDLKGKRVDVTTTKLPVDGGFGMRLLDMLHQARDFVKYNSTEFLILKFDKCTNWELIAEVCERELEGYLYTGSGSLNEKTLEALKRHVVVLFTPKGIEAVSGRGYNSQRGIFGCQNLTKKGAYSFNYDGLQYIGKGGTSPTDGDSDMGKIASNIEKQSSLMSRGASHADPEVMGMMYWTTTGLKRSIQERNQTMWGDDNRPTLLTDLWTAGFEESIQNRLPRYLEMTNYANGPALKAFMPNIVMIDFADLDKCKFIFELNTTAATLLTQTAQKVAKARNLVQGKASPRQRAGVPF